MDGSSTGSSTTGPCGGVALVGGRVCDGFGIGGVPLTPGPAVCVPSAGVSVLPGSPGSPGLVVPVAPAMGMEVGGRIGTVSTCPSASELGSAILFALTISSRVTPKRLAMSQSVSPALTV